MTIEGTENAKRRQRPRVKRPAGPGRPQPRSERLSTGDEPDRNEYLNPTPAMAPIGAQPISGERVDAPVNPYAPTGWQTKTRTEFDVRMPSGQMCRLLRLEREDLFRLNLMDYLDTFTPILMGDFSEDEAEDLMQETMKEDPEALKQMFLAIDKVVLAATLKPQVTEDPDEVNIGSPEDWNNPDFVPVVPLNNIPMEERMYIFGAAFGKSMDDLKSLWAQATGVGSMDDVAVVQQAAQ